MESAFVEDCGDGTFRLVCHYGGETEDGLCLGVSEGPCHDWYQ
ncbi:MAG TPA: hypothetical protein VGG03_16055 [Thermoanaerobaculia bacterium]